MNEAKICVICGKHTERMACIRCQNRISNHLSDIVEYVALAQNELQPATGGDGRGSELGLGVRIDALDLVAGNDVLPTLESWERMYREEWGYAKWEDTKRERGRGKANQASAYFTGTVAFLRGNLDRICEHPAVDQFHVQTTACWHRARSAARQQPRQAWRVTCPADVDDGECGKSLRITGEDVDRDIPCKACGTIWTLRRLLLVAIASGVPIWLDLDSAADYFTLHPTTLRKWAKAGYVIRRGNQYDFQSIYTYIELGKAKKAANI
jgi:hypothetical protein